jgi:hypothetical protein
LHLNKGKRKTCRREMLMNKEIERCCRPIAKMMEKYSSTILRDIESEIQYRSEQRTENADGKKSKFTAYVKFFSAYHCKAA